MLSAGARARRCVVAIATAVVGGASLGGITVGLALGAPTAHVQAPTSGRALAAAERKLNALRAYLVRPQTVSIAAVTMLSRATADCNALSAYCPPSPGIDANPGPGGGGGVLSDVSGPYYAAVALPAGATVTKLQLVAYDNLAVDTFDVGAVLYAARPHAPKSIPVASVGTVGAQARGYQTVTTDHIRSSAAKIDPSRAYYVVVDVPNVVPRTPQLLYPVMVRITYKPASPF
jgi:hypothetical protein